jgi:hypothetical protein
MRLVRRIAITSLALAAACGKDKDNATPDATPPTPDAPGGFQTAAHTPMPQAIPHGGKIIAHPQLVTITFSDDSFATMENAFGDAIVGDPWMTTTGNDYGVGTGTSAAKVTLGAAPASLDFAGVQTLIEGKINDGTLPAPDATGDQHIYMLYVPRKVTLAADLQDEYGHHGMGTGKGVHIAYAVILDPSFNTDELNGITSTAAHELMEAATDPYDSPDDGWYVDPPLPDPWWEIAGEVGDLCDGEALIQAGGFAVQRIYSNTAAAAGKNPCVPEDPDDAWQDVTVTPATMPTVAAGGTATFTLTGWSTSQVPDWALDDYTADYSDLADTDMNPTFSSKMINNGTSVMLTLHVPASATSGQTGALYILSGPQIRPWPVGFIVK